MRGIDWDSVSRQRKVWKPDYRENLRKPFDQWPRVRLPKQVPSANRRRFFKAPATVGEIEKRLRAYGLTGRRLAELINKVVAGKDDLRWIEYDLECEEMKKAGFMPLPAVQEKERIVMTFELRSPKGELIEERIYTFRLPKT